MEQEEKSQYNRRKGDLANEVLQLCLWTYLTDSKMFERRLVFPVTVTVTE